MRWHIADAHASEVTDLRIAMLQHALRETERRRQRHLWRAAYIAGWAAAGGIVFLLIYVAAMTLAGGIGLFFGDPGADASTSWTVILWTFLAIYVAAFAVAVVPGVMAGRELIRELSITRKMDRVEASLRDAG